ncbi:MAG: hypothetical protein IPJ65_21475 [Archangiaceae bacterium]|nr:hypothetical protein [Archangiaceae bacterium]
MWVFSSTDCSPVGSGGAMGSSLLRGPDAFLCSGGLALALGAKELEVRRHAPDGRDVGVRGAEPSGNADGLGLAAFGRGRGVVAQRGELVLERHHRGVRRAARRPEVAVSIRADRREQGEGALEVGAHLGRRGAGERGDLGAGDALEQAEDEALAGESVEVAKPAERLLAFGDQRPPAGQLHGRAGRLAQRLRPAPRQVDDEGAEAGRVFELGKLAQRFVEARLHLVVRDVHREVCHQRSVHERREVADQLFARRPVATARTVDPRDPHWRRS